MGILDVITLFGGIALFLYGMNIMGSGLEKVAGGKIERILQKLTSNPLKGVLLGTIITALIQSSTATTIIIIGLVNSGILQFYQGIGIIMGANIGTTVTGQLIRLADISGGSLILQLLKPTALAPIVATIGIVFFFFMKSPKRRNVGQILMGFAILFTGLFTMEGGLEPLKTSEVFRQMFSSLQNPVLGLLAGILVTTILNSSSASVGILQALTSTGVVTWGSAIPIILGQNIGTCSTSLIAASGASKSAKRIAVVHLYFNVIGSVIFMAAIYIFKAAVGLPFWGDAMNKGDIATFHTIFNIASTLLFLPFTRLLARLAEWTVRDKPGEADESLEVTVLDERLYNSPSLALQQARKAITQMALNAQLNQREAIPLLMRHDYKLIALINEREDVVDKLESSVSNYLINLNDLDLTEEESAELTMLLNYVTEFERIGDYAINVVDRSGEVFDKQISFSPSAQSDLLVLQDAVSEILSLTILAFTKNDILAAGKVEPLEETVDMICEILRENHIRRLKDGLCNIEAGIVFLSVLVDYERISDHCSNIAARMLSATMPSGHFNTHELRRNMHAGQLDQYNQQLAQYNDKYLPRIAPGDDTLAADCQPVKTS